jgi:hypothetical protein
VAVGTTGASGPISSGAYTASPFASADLQVRYLKGQCTPAPLTASTSYFNRSPKSGSACEQICG